MPTRKLKVRQINELMRSYLRGPVVKLVSLFKFFPDVNVIELDECFSFETRAHCLLQPYSHVGDPFGVRHPIYVRRDMPVTTCARKIKTAYPRLLVLLLLALLRF